MDPYTLGARGSALDQAHIAVGGREHISLMSVKLTRINRATGRRKESSEDPRRAPIAQEQHTSSIRFPQGAYIRLSPGSPIPPKRRRDPHTLGSPHPPVWFHDGYRPCDLAPSRWVHSRVTLGVTRHDPCALVRPACPVRVPCVTRLPPVSFYRSSPRCLFTD